MTDFIRRIGSPPANELFVKDSVNNTNWIKWTNNVQDIVDSAEYYGNPSVALNSDFYWQRGVPVSITQADGDGAFFAEKWQIHGAPVATYTIARTAWPANAIDQIGSLYYTSFVISNYAGTGTPADFYAYQEQDGAQFLRRYQNRIISMSMKVNNNQGKSIKCRFELYYFYNGSTPQAYMGQDFEVASGLTEISSQLQTDDLSKYTVGGAPYIQFRLVFCDLVDNTANLDVSYIKPEMADDASILYVDHALEKTRIDNS